MFLNGFAVETAVSIFDSITPLMSVIEAQPPAITTWLTAPDLTRRIEKLQRAIHLLCHGFHERLQYFEFVIVR